MDSLRKQRQACHKECGDVKILTSLVMQAVAFWDEVVVVTNTATVETERLQRIVNLADRQTDPVRILRSPGTKTKMQSFKACWMEVAKMIHSDGNNVIFRKVVPRLFLGIHNRPYMRHAPRRSNLSVHFLLLYQIIELYTLRYKKDLKLEQQFLLARLRALLETSVSN